MSNALLALWIALIGADRIDLAGGHGPFILTPFLALTPIVALSELVRRRRSGRRIELSRNAIGYAAVATALVCVALLSVFGAEEMPVSAARTFLLVADVAGTFVVALLCADRTDLVPVLARGAIGCLVLFVLFDLAEVLYYIGRGPELLRLGPVTARFDQLQTAGPLPRLAGPVADSNRGGFMLVFYLAIIAAGAGRRWTRRVALTAGVLLLVLAFSRSATLAAAATLVMATLTQRQRISPWWIAVGGLAVATAVTAVLVKPRLFDRVATVLESPVARRFSTNEGSAQSHVELIARGLTEATESVPRAAMGLGYGNSYLVLQDMFPGNRYGNFHSLYVTMFAEAGIVALLLTLVLMGTPLVLGGPWRALIAGAVAFNVFYQTTTEPAFWFLLALAWLTMRRARRLPGPTATVEGER
jgi:hypothetical protein